jgi:hypothetical protein
MTYKQFIKAVCAQPRGWRCEIVCGEIRLSGHGRTLEENHTAIAVIQMMYKVFSDNTALAAQMMDSPSDLVAAAAQAWLKQ